MDVLAIILACSLHPDDALIRTLVDVESNGNVYFVGDLTTLKTNDSFTSAKAALSFAEQLQRHGGRPAVGLVGIPLEWASRYGRAPIDLFDGGCTNVAVATAAFSEYQKRCSPAHPHQAHRPLASRRRRTRRALGTAALRICELSLFARDLGVVGTPAAILRRLGDDRRASSAFTQDAPPQHSSVFVEGPGSGQPTSATIPSPSIFLGSPPKISEAR